MALSLRLFGISPGDDGHHRDLQSLAEAASRGGMDGLILREPVRSERALVTLARRLSPWLGPGLILHASHPSAVDIAVASGWGLHLPGDGEPNRLRSQITGLLGISCHSTDDLKAAANAGCDYAVLSPVFQPHSKPLDKRATLGLKGLRSAAKDCPIPVIALGGITPESVPRCTRAGAHGVATLGGLFGPDMSPEDVHAAAHALRSAFA